MTTKLDIFKADSEVKAIAADIINGILADEGLGETIEPTQIHGLGCGGGWQAATYSMTAMGRFAVYAELTDTGKLRKPIQIAISITDGLLRVTRKTIRRNA